MNEFFQCTVCFENFDTKLKIPRLLPCQHSFCSICLPKLFINANRYYELYTYRNEASSLSHVECPVCRAKHYTKIEDVPKSRLILNLIELTNGNQNNIRELLVNSNKINRSNSPSSSDDDASSPPESPSPSSSSPPNSTTSSRNDLTVTQMTSPSTVNQIPIISTTNHRSSSSNVRRILLSSNNNNNTTQITPPPFSAPRVFVSNYQTYSSEINNRTNRESNLRNHYQYSINNNNRYTSNSYIRTPRSHSVNSRFESGGGGGTRLNDSALNLSNSNSNLNTLIRQTSAVKRVNVPQNRSTTIQQQTNDNSWDLKHYLRNLFQDMDVNKDGRLCFDELQEALRRGQPNSEFNVKTVQLLFEKYDRNKDGEIDFDGFYEMYVYLNNEYFKFLNMDKDGNGIVDANELYDSFLARGYNFKREFFNYIESTMRETNKNGITFDNYCRLTARFDYLTNIFTNTPRYQASHTLESYLKKTFFFNFW